MSTNKICKAIFQFYAFEQCGTIYDINTKRNRYLNDLSAEDAAILEMYYEKNSLGSTSNAPSRLNSIKFRRDNLCFIDIQQKITDQLVITQNGDEFNFNGVIVDMMEQTF